MRKNNFLGIAALITTTLIWGTSFVVLKTTLDEISVMWVLAFRFIIASAIFLFAARNKLKEVDMRTVIGGMLMGSSMAVAYILQTFGLYYTTPGKNAFLTAGYCILVPFLAWLFYKRKPTFINLIAAVVCLIGIGFISLSDGFGIINKGDMLTLCCGLFYGLQLIIIEEYVSDCDVVALSAIEFSTSALICLAGALIFEPFPGLMSSLAVLKILYMGIMCTAICFFLQAWGQQYTSSALAAVIMPLESVFGALISVLFYGENVTKRFIIGAFLMIGAVFINELKITRRS